MLGDGGRGGKGWLGIGRRRSWPGSGVVRSRAAAVRSREATVRSRAAREAAAVRLRAASGGGGED